VGKTQLPWSTPIRSLADYEIVWWVGSQEPAKLAADLRPSLKPLGLPEKAHRTSRAILGQCGAN